MKQLNIAAMLVMVIGLIMYILLREEYTIWIYGIGAIFFAIQRIVEMVKQRSANTGISRLPQIRLFSAAALLGAAYLMYDGSNSWSILLLVSAVLEVYVSFRES